MNELDLYNGYQLPAKTPAKKHRKSHKKGYKWFVGLIITMFLVIIFFVANAFSNILTFSNVSLFKAKAIVVKGFNIYAVTIGAYEDEKSATMQAEEVQLSGAGGYVMYDLNYCVVLNAYLSSSDAQNVLEKVIKTKADAELKVIEINRCQLQGVSDKEEREEVENALNIFKDTYQNLYDISINLDLSKITTAEAKVKLAELLNEVSNKASSFRDVAKKMTDAKFSLTQAKIDQVVNLLNTLVESALTSTRLSSLIKHAQISCLMLQNELALLLA